MEASKTITSLLLAVLTITAPMAAGGTQDNPNGTDDTDEPDPRTAGVTAIPDSMDVTGFWITPKTDGTVTFGIEVFSLFVPHTLTVPSGFDREEIRYQLQFDVKPSVFDGSDFCEGATGGFVQARTTGGTFNYAPIPSATGSPSDTSTDELFANVGCIFPDGSTGGFQCFGTFAEANQAQRSILIEVDKQCSQSFTTPEKIPFLEAGTTLENPEVFVAREDRNTVEAIYDIAYENDATPGDSWDYFDHAGPGTSQTI